jgi:hypothetical protein
MVKRLTAKIGEYEKDGQTKGRYVEVGVILSSDKGEYILMDPTVNLAGVLTLQNMLNHKAGRKLSDRVMVSIFSEDRGNGGGGQGGGAGPEDDSILF